MINIDSDLMEIAKKMGWKENNGRWWNASFVPMQNTLIWFQVKQKLGWD